MFENDSRRRTEGEKHHARINNLGYDVLYYTSISSGAYNIIYVVVFLCDEYKTDWRLAIAGVAVYLIYLEQWISVLCRPKLCGV